MRYMIIEDEEMLASHLKMLINEIRPAYELKYTAESVEDALEILTSNSKEIDVIFMDIRLADGLCFDIFDEIDVQIPVIFTTAYNDYLPDVFKAVCVDYLLKPISAGALEECLIRFENRTSALKERFAKEPLPAQKGLVVRRNRILVSSGEGYKILPVSDIYYFLSQGKYVIAVLKDGDQEITDFNNLSEVQEILDPEQFFAVARNIVASVDAITSVKKHYSGRLKIEVSAGSLKTEVFISIARKKLFLEWLGGASGL